MKLLVLMLFGLFILVTVHGDCEFDDSSAEPKQYIAGNRNAADKRKYRNYQWDKKDGIAEVPYYFESNFTCDSRSQLRKIFKDFEEKACVKFVESKPSNKTTKRYLSEKILRIYKKPLNSSHLIGAVSVVNGLSLWMNKNYNEVSIGIPRYKKNWISTVNHEVFHVFGIQHTQKRNDSRNYIEVLKENIVSGKDEQFDPCAHCEIPPGIPYDCSSILHYNTRNFGNGKGPTIRTLNESKCRQEDLVRGAREATDNDWKALRYHLGC